MKRLLLIFIFLGAIADLFSQQRIVYSADSSRIVYASFSEVHNDYYLDTYFFADFLQIDSKNVFYANDTLFSPDSSYCYIQYRQYYDGYEVENTRVILTWHNNRVIRLNGIYVPIKETLIVDDISSEDDAVLTYNKYYGLMGNAHYHISLIITEDFQNPSHAVLCYRIESDAPSSMGKSLYLNASNLLVVKEDNLPSSGFNSTLYTRYNGVREANTEQTSSGYTLRDSIAAVEVLKCNSAPNYFGGILDMYYNSSTTWGADSASTCPSYVLDAYWAACQYSYYMQNKFNCPKTFFQPSNDYYTSIFVASNGIIDETHWQRISFTPSGKEDPHPYFKNIIFIGVPGANHNPKSSIDEVVHEFAHIFSHQSWDLHNYNSFWGSSDLAEACADIWAAIITHEFYPDNEDRIWKIGEDIVLPTSENTCVRNLANPVDATAEIPMIANYCDSLEGTSYEMSGVISHWFYLLTHGYQGQGCDGECYVFSAIPIDTAAKLLYYCERTCFRSGMEYSDICRATMDATDNFSNSDTLRASVLGAWNVLGVRLDDSYGVEQYGLSLNSTNTSDYTIDRNLIIDSMQTLTVSGTLLMNSSSRIIVRPGGKLIVDGGTLTSACAGEMWQGIYVEGHRNQHQTAANQGTVQLINGAVVENALRGVRTGAPGSSWNTTGGIITADSATFRNCAKAVEYLSYADTTYPGFINDNWGSFQNCTFTVDDNNLFAANNTDFLAHVTMWDVKGVSFTRCRFEDVRTQSHTRNSAINTIDAGFKVRTSCDYIMPNPDCNCYLTTNTYCSFTGFNTAINATTSGRPYAVIIDGARFSNNVTGVRIGGNSHAEVTRCTFDLNVPMGISFKPATGLSLDTCTGYLVEGNTFICSATSPQYQRCGISVGNSGLDANTIYRNDFSNMSVGVYVQGDNGKKLTGLQFACNGFSGNENDIYVATSATIGTSQGSPSKGADNTFSSRATNNLYNGGTVPVNYYYSTGSGHAPSHTTNVNVYGTATANTCGSTICGYNPDIPIPPPGPKSPTPGFLALKQQYENLQADFDRNGYANILATAIPPQAEPPATSDELVAAQYAARQINAIATELYAQSHMAVRSLMADTLEDVQAVHAWLDATPGLASRYLAVETGFAMVSDIANHVTTQAERDEYDNYVAFQALKDALAYGNGHVAWPHATDAQVWELVRIADANTGRSSLLAKNVLCFFFEICYDDVEMRVLATTAIPPKAEPQTLTDQQNIIVHPNPTDNVLHVSVTDGEIAQIEMFDAFGRNIPVGANNHSPLQTTINTSKLPSGVYVLRITLRDGGIRTMKVVKR